MEFIKELLTKAFTIDTIWGVALRGAIWFLIAIVILFSVAAGQEEDDSGKTLRSNLGFLLMFLILGGVLFFLLFGYTPA